MTSVVNLVGIPGQNLFVNRICVTVLKGMNRTKIDLINAKASFPVLSKLSHGRHLSFGILHKR